MKRRAILYVVPEDWYFVTHRLALARAAVAAGYEVAVATRVGSHGDAITAAGCRLIPLQWARATGRPWKELPVIPQLSREMRAFDPGIIHCVALKAVILGQLAAVLARSKAATVNAVAGLGYAFTSREAKARILRVAVKLALRPTLGRGDATIVQNVDDATALIQSGLVPESRLVLIRGAGVDLEHFRVRPEPAELTVLLASRMLWDKGVGEFVAAATELRKLHPEARFVLVGAPDPGNPRAIPQEQLAAWAASGVVEWWGRREDMPEVLASASIFCLPTVYGEGIPKVLLEAAASGRAIVTTDAPGCRDAVRDGETGLLVPGKDQAALVRALRTLIEDSSLRQRMGAAGRGRVEREFAQEKVISETLQVYARVAA